jgi:hypothetical protein
MNKIIIGIDPGTNTGFAAKDLKAGAFLEIKTVGIIEAMKDVERYMETYGRENVYLVFEDARKRRWFGEKGKEALQGAGSIKRDCSIWEEFCNYKNIQFIAPAPAKGKTKYTSEYFKRLTGWKQRTSEHSRDAVILVYGFNLVNLKLHFGRQLQGMEYGMV